MDVSIRISVSISIGSGSAVALVTVGRQRSRLPVWIPLRGHGLAMTNAVCENGYTGAYCRGTPWDVGVLRDIGGIAARSARVAVRQKTEGGVLRVISPPTLCLSRLRSQISVAFTHIVG